MKKIIYTVFILTLACFTSCNKDESEEVINEASLINQGAIEIVEDTNARPFTRIKTSLQPGIYGPSNVDALTNVSYTYIPTQEALNAIPPQNRRFGIFFKVLTNNQNTMPFFWQIKSQSVPSNTVIAKFPLSWWSGNAMVDWTGMVKIWKITYMMYHSDGWVYFDADKIVTVNHDIN